MLVRNSKRSRDVLASLLEHRDDELSSAVRPLPPPPHTHKHNASILWGSGDVSLFLSDHQYDEFVFNCTFDNCGLVLMSVLRCMGNGPCKMFSCKTLSSNWDVVRNKLRWGVTCQGQ